MKKLDYPQEAYEMLFKIESKHFWFWGRNKIIESFIRKHIKNVNKTSFLEVGCGNGIVLSHLERIGLKVNGLDMNLEGLKFARTRTSASLYHGDSTMMKLSKKYHAIGLFDVIEHLDDDIAYLKDCKKFLKPNGIVFITVPAFMLLWSSADERSNHKRRYTKRSLKEIVEKAGYEVENIQYFNSLLFLPQLLLRRLHDKKNNKKNRLAPLKEGLMIPAFYVNELLKAMLSFEDKLHRFVSFPFGASIILSARKS